MENRMRRSFFGGVRCRRCLSCLKTAEVPAEGRASQTLGIPVFLHNVKEAHVHAFQIRALPLEQFKELFPLSDAQLAERGARRYIADEKPGFPCRVSLVDAEIGESVILLAFTHHDVASPYRASGPIFVREQAEEARLDVNEVPEVVRRRLMSIRAYDGTGMMIAADITEGTNLEQRIERFFANDRVAYLHLHNAKPGCYSCFVEPVT